MSASLAADNRSPKLYFLCIEKNSAHEIGDAGERPLNLLHASRRRIESPRTVLSTTSYVHPHLSRILENLPSRTSTQLVPVRPSFPRVPLSYPGPGHATSRYPTQSLTPLPAPRPQTSRLVSMQDVESSRAGRSSAFPGASFCVLVRLVGTYRTRQSSAFAVRPSHTSQPPRAGCESTRGLRCSARSAVRGGR
ncbi:hypothetical protein SCHPADRAFT_745739 [Schizopora paradoxa]|uniref:Uncharacterized protein n=1 Tax=Schizopora paradoxa TaxID=27342 RepID=A0A0H2RIU9_9AGAM|nr:hypothetical protein SCHPADRAFT_745739 [Schizopora paradoxa]